MSKDVILSEYSMSPQLKEEIRNCPNCIDKGHPFWILCKAHGGR